jgi:hypothetical protein
MNIRIRLFTAGKDQPMILSSDQFAFMMRIVRAVSFKREQTANTFIQALSDEERLEWRRILIRTLDLLGPTDEEYNAWLRTHDEKY